MLALPCPDTRGRAAGSGIALCRPNGRARFGHGLPEGLSFGRQENKKSLLKDCSHSSYRRAGNIVEDGGSRPAV